jgi:hypothetical protein
MRSHDDRKLYCLTTAIVAGSPQTPRHLRIEAARARREPVGPGLGGLAAAVVR